MLIKLLILIMRKLVRNGLWIGFICCIVDLCVVEKASDYYRGRCVYYVVWCANYYIIHCVESTVSVYWHVCIVCIISVLTISFVYYCIGSVYVILYIFINCYYYFYLILFWKFGWIRSAFYAITYFLPSCI